MKTQTISVPVDRLQAAVHDRLYGNARTRKGAVRWTEGSSELVVYPDTVSVRLSSGWIQVNLKLESDQTGAVTTGLFFAVARDGASLNVATSLDLPDPSGILSIWGPALQDAIWAGLLDGLEMAANASVGKGLWVAQGLSGDAQGLKLLVGSAS